MKSIILYPENDRYVLKRIYKIFNSRGLKVDASKINRDWSMVQLSALFGVLDMYSHVFVILSSEFFNDPWLQGLMGYINGSNKNSFFYFTENDNALDRFFSKYPNGHGYDYVEKYADSESVRFNSIRIKEEARENLINNGFALSADSLGECISSGLIDIVVNYIDAGFSSSIRNSKGVPMLCIAVRFNKLDIIKYLIEHGADINAISEDRHNTPLMDAAAIGELESIKLFISEGADLEIQSKNGQTALILAVGQGDIEISNYLLSAGADYEVKDSLGMSAKKYATLFGKEEILVNMKWFLFNSLFFFNFFL